MHVPNAARDIQRNQNGYQGLEDPQEIPFAMQRRLFPETRLAPNPELHDVGCLGKIINYEGYT